VGRSIRKSNKPESLRQPLDIGTYYVQVYPNKSSENTKYVLTLLISPIPTPIAEPVVFAEPVVEPVPMPIPTPTPIVEPVPSRVSRYDYTYYYNGNGDYYQGYVYALTGTYAVGDYYDFVDRENETGANGKYYINSGVAVNNEADLGKVYVSSYYDSETNASYAPYPESGYSFFGYSYLGREAGYLMNRQNTVNNFYFGKDNYEADTVFMDKSNLVEISRVVFSGKEGDSGTFQVKLTKVPTLDIVLTFSTDQFLTVDADNTVDNGTQNSITFSAENWNQPRTCWFIAEKDGFNRDRTSNNKIPYYLTLNNKIPYQLGNEVIGVPVTTPAPGEGDGSYDLGTIVNTYAPDTTKYNIDLDFRNDYLGYWTSDRRRIAQNAADDWAERIANELPDYTSDSKISMYNPTSLNFNGEFIFETNRFIDDLVIFMSAYEVSDGAGGWGRPGAGGFTPSEPLPRIGMVTLYASDYGYDNPLFYSIISHEIGHVLGLVGVTAKGQELIDSADPSTATFKGEYARVANGGFYVPLQSQDGVNPVTGVYNYAHPANGVYSVMSYGNGASSPTNIDYAMLADSGYRIKGINA
jgi:hypothetical protein